MDFRDKRGRRVIFVNHCLLNQNARAPGVAVREGAFSELIEILLDNDLSIEQLPCVESMTMGGSDRKTLDKYQPLISNAIRNNWFPLLRSFLKLWLILNYQRTCKKEAQQICKKINEYIRQDYTVVGVIGVNDSPTCGVTKTLDIIEYIRQVSISQNEDNPAPEAVQVTLRDGDSYFIGEIKKWIRKNKRNIEVVGFEPWADSPKHEAIRIARLLNLRVADSDLMSD